MKEELIRKYNLHFNNIDLKKPITLGNGDFAITLDQTGTQSLYNEFNDIPLTTISNKNWFYKDLTNIKIKPTYIDGKSYMLYNFDNNKNFNLLRQYPHKYSFMHMVLLDENNNIINKDYITNISSELDLYLGIFKSSFNYNKKEVKTTSLIYQDNDQLSFNLKSTNLKLALIFNYPSYEKTGYKKGNVDIKILNDKISLIYDEINSLTFNIKSTCNYILHDNMIIFNDNVLNLKLSLDDIKDEGKMLDSFWEEDNGIVIDNDILVRRMVLSKYLLHINSTGIYPPSEAGLTYNNWNSKFHLEMHLIHSLWNIYNNHLNDVLKSFDYYLSIYSTSKKRAKLNGYKGIRLPKMTSPDGADSPSNIGPLLIWQAPHILFMLQEIYYIYNRKDILSKYELLIKGTLDFMISLFKYKDSKYQILDPILECCEAISVDKCANPMFEIEYFRYVLQRQKSIDIELYNKYQYDYDEYINNLIEPKIDDKIYLKTSMIKDKYEIYKDHPTEVFSYSYFKSDRIDKNIMKNTIDYVINNMDLSSYWGWDFPLMGLCYLNLGFIDESINITLYDSVNNQYLYNGHNTSFRDDLKVYLPGNGAFLIYYYFLSLKISKKTNIINKKEL